MSVIFILIACSLLLAGSFLGAFLWASRSGQFEDDYTPSVRILFEEESMTPPTLRVETPANQMAGDKKSSTKPSDHVRKQRKSRS